jgi:hypothetical protein
MPKKKTGGKPVKAKSVKPKSDYVGSDWLLLTEITADPEVQARVELDEEVVADYSRAMLEQVDTKEGLQFPPCTVFREGKKTFWLADGFHRFNAALRTDGKVDRLDCEIRQGGKRDAMLFALGSNTDHGLRRTSADKRKAVSVILRDDEWKQWSSREIARRCGVSNTFVDNIRNESLTTVVSESPNQASTGAPAEDEDKRRKYRTKHGTESTMRTGGRKRRKKAVKDDSDQPVEPVEPVEVAEPSPVAEPDAVDTEPVAGSVEEHHANLQVEALRRANEGLAQDKRALQDKIVALEGRISTAEPGGTLSEFQTAIDKWRDTVETQKDIIAKLQNENASLRAGVDAAPAVGIEPQSLADLFNRVIDVLALLDGMLSEGPDRWPKKVSARSRNQQISEVHSFLARLRGFRDVIELHSGVSEEEQS